jgi:hypothetical protein
LYFSVLTIHALHVLERRTRVLEYSSSYSIVLVSTMHNLLCRNEDISKRENSPLK